MSTATGLYRVLTHVAVIISKVGRVVVINKPTLCRASINFHKPVEEDVYYYCNLYGILI